jgi:hypothetical protein
MTVDTKEKGTPTQGAIDADQLSILCNISDSSITNWSGTAIKSGTCGSVGYTNFDDQFASVMQ